MADVELWIDGQQYFVPHRVRAHLRFLEELNGQLCQGVVKASDAAEAMHALLEQRYRRPFAWPADFRWTSARKLAVVTMVGSGLVARSDVIRMFEISEEELASWERRAKWRGEEALRAMEQQNGPRP